MLWLRGHRAFISGVPYGLMGKTDANVTTQLWADITAGAVQPKERGGEETRERMEEHETQLGSTNK
jgi:hypothetical protein